MLQKYLEEIHEYGPESMIENILKNKQNKTKPIKKAFKVIIEYMFANKKFMEKLHTLACMMTACIRS